MYFLKQTHDIYLCHDNDDAKYFKCEYMILMRGFVNHSLNQRSSGTRNLNRIITHWFPLWLVLGSSRPRWAHTKCFGTSIIKTWLWVILGLSTYDPVIFMTCLGSFQLDMAWPTTRSSWSSIGPMQLHVWSHPFV